MIVVYLIIAAVLGGDLGWWYWADRQVRHSARRRWLRGVLGAFIGSQALYITYFIVAPRSARRSNQLIPMPFVAGAYLWHLLLLPVGLLLAAGCAVWSTWARPVAGGRSTTVTTSAVSRRDLLQAAAVAIPPLITVAAAGRSIPQLDQFRIRRLTLRIPTLPAALDGMRIAQLSDLHIGKFTRPGFLSKVVDATNQLRVDLVVFTGDLIDLSLEDLGRGIDAMKHLDPRSGFAMIEGNHDLIEDPDAFDRRTTAAGLPLLLNQSVTHSVRGQRVQLLGIRWGTAVGNRRQADDAAFADSVAAVRAQRDPTAFPILLGHHPHCFDAAAVDFPLVLSGHTHGGQLMLSNQLGFGPLFFRYWSGVYRRGESTLVVNNGVGNWFPLRVNAPAEIIDLTLRC